MNKEKIIINPPLTPPLSKEGNQKINQDENYLYSNGLICRGGHLPYNPNLKQRASQMRKNMTIAEKYLWKNYLQKSGYKVLRQKPIDNYIVDFYLPKFRLIIEVDGEIHDNQIEYDAIRTELLKKYELDIIRLTNVEILHDIIQVQEKIYKKISCSPLG